MRPFTVWICAIILAVGVWLAAGFNKMRDIKGKTRPSERFLLSASELAALKSKADTQQDGDAAFKVAMHYGAGPNKDPDMLLLWMRKAESLGNASAKMVFENQNAGNGAAGAASKD